MHNKLPQFWQELKRRKVVRVITVYAAAAFVILELVDIIAEPLKLPSWLLPVVIVLLSIGFIIAIIFSWIYDIHPEGGIVKTEPAHKEKKEEVPKSSNGWKIASFVSFAVIVCLIVLNVIPRPNQKNANEILDKSIAVIPFLSLSDDPEKQYLADGVMDAILLHLSKIEDLRVMSRTSVEQYRNTDKTVTEICEELDVAFLLEGNFRKYGDQARLIVQLIQPGTEDHVWANEYDREWKDIFAVESEVAQAIAKQLYAVITPEEKQLIEKIPTDNLTAYDFMQRSHNEGWRYVWTGKKEALDKAEAFTNKALEYDSAFAEAYVGLAFVSWGKHRLNPHLSESYLDSMRILADLALSFDDQLSEGYRARGLYYVEIKRTEEAIKEYDKAIGLNPNDWRAYMMKGYLYYYTDLVKAIDNFHRAISLHRGPNLPGILRQIGKCYARANFREKGINYMTEAVQLDDDSVTHFNGLTEIENAYGHFEKSIEYGEKAFTIDSTNTDVLALLGMNYCYLGQHDAYLEYYQKIEKADSMGITSFIDAFRIGHAHMMNGFKEKAEFFFKRGTELHNEKVLELDRGITTSPYTYYNVAAVYSFLGERDKAYKYLRLMNQPQRIPMYIVKDLTHDPFFESIRDEPEFQEIVRDVEAKHQAEHERVRQWMEENEML